MGLGAVGCLAEPPQEKLSKPRLPFRLTATIAVILERTSPSAPKQPEQGRELARSESEDSNRQEAVACARERPGCHADPQPKRAIPVPRRNESVAAASVSRRQAVVPSEKGDREASAEATASAVWRGTFGSGATAGAVGLLSTQVSESASESGFPVKAFARQPASLWLRSVLQRSPTLRRGTRLVNRRI